MAKARLHRPLAVSLGDPAGVGPELIAAAWAARDREALPPFVAVGGVRLLAAAAASRGLQVPIEPVATSSDAAAVFDRALPVIGTIDGPWRPGDPDEDGSALAFESLKRASELAISGEAAGVVTGPVAKSRLAAVGFNFPGQTEFVAHACGIPAQDAVMMLAGPQLRTVPLTIHVALARVPAAISVDLILRKVRITSMALQRDFGIERPRIAVAALNPHAGEDGRMGDEERRVIAPAIDALRTEGLSVTGPHSADALFAPHARGGYDVAICMYHDQALIPLKALDFDSGVNVTLGLPIVRASPDHGTAFDIAGTGRASAGATIAAMRLAGECAARRASHGS